MFTGLEFLSIGYSLLRFLSDTRLEDLSRRSGCVLNLENAMEHHVLKMINECRLPVPSLRAREEDQDPAPDAGDASQWKILHRAYLKNVIGEALPYQIWPAVDAHPSLSTASETVTSSNSLQMLPTTSRSSDLNPRSTLINYSATPSCVH
jgi:hypothetical protein